MISYSLFDKLQAGDEEFEEMGFSGQDYVISYDFATGMLGEPLDISDGEDYYSYLEQSGLLWRWKVGEQETVATGYDGNLQPVREFIAPADIWGEICPNGEHYYFVSSGKLYRADTNQRIDGAEEVIFDRAFSVQLLFDVFQNENGEDFGLLYGVAGDLKKYSAIINLDAGEMLYLNKESDIAYIENGVFAVDQ